MATFAQRKANRKYDKKNTKTYLLKVNKKTEKAILDKLESVPSKNGYIKQLILADIRSKESGVSQNAL